MSPRRVLPGLATVAAILVVAASCGSTETTTVDEADGAGLGINAEPTTSEPAVGEPLDDHGSGDGEPLNHPSPSPDATTETADEETLTPPGDVVIESDRGEGWRLVEVVPGRGSPHEVAIVTTERGFDRAASLRWFEAPPNPDFVDDVVIVLAPSVSGSCPGITFSGLTIADNRVFGRFKTGPQPDGATFCTADANPIAFVFVIERAVLPDRFTLSVEDEVVCGGCERAELDVDLSDEAALEVFQWGSGTFNIVIDGTPPGDGRANVFRWGDEAALLLSGLEFVNLPRWIQSFPGDQAITIDGFVVDCGGTTCPEECDDERCQDLVPLGEVCTYRYQPEPFTDRTATIIWNDTTCEIESASP